MVLIIRRKPIIPLVFLVVFFCIVYTAEAQGILASSTTRHAFSDAFKQDIFKLTLKGSSLVESEATFEIFDANGKSLYTETFMADMLFSGPSADDSNQDQKQKEAYILKRVNEFFKEENFDKPAIDIKEESDIDHNPDLQIWELVRGDRTAIGFNFILNDSSQRKMAWVKKWRRLVVYWEEG